MVGEVLQATTEEVVLKELLGGKNTCHMVVRLPSISFSPTVINGLLGVQSGVTLKTPFELGVLRMTKKAMLVMLLTMTLLRRAIHSPPVTMKVRKI
ncbi:unnamed protein product [Linum tenue]|uniref:Uncharacterized protein n=1 Tax=Linum tenue TaxID=586396 RepID=A0AAV0P1W4_9ROSI|nr:unnamed protein product [Linum tenue]CAI0464950.1 unnamed protein product [Linum tenue]